jgi:hypothetical protein
MPYLLITSALIATIGLFLTLKHEIGRDGRRHKRRIDEMAARLDEAARAPLSEAPAYIPSPPRAGLNLSKRVHAMRMLRRGEDIAHIAAALTVPRKEIELLIRVQSIVKTRAAKAGFEE